MWVTEIKDWEKVGIDSYKLFVSESDKMLKDISDDSEKITNRVYNLVSILIILYGAIIATIIKCSSEPTYSGLIIPFSIEAVFITYVFYNLYKLIKSRIIYRIGTEPSEIFIPDYFEVSGDSEDEKQKRVYLHIIEQSQEKITLNEAINKFRIQVFNNTLRLLIYSLLGLIVVVSVILLCTTF